MGEGFGLDSRALRRNEDAGPARCGIELRQVHDQGDQADVGAGVGAAGRKLRQGRREQPDGGRAFHGDHQQPGVVRRAAGGDPPAVRGARHGVGPRPAEQCHAFAAQLGDQRGDEGVHPAAQSCDGGPRLAQPGGRRRGAGRLCRGGPAEWGPCVARGSR